MKVWIQLLGSYNWGFFVLELDCQFFNMGKLVISQVFGVLFDGSLFEFGGNIELFVFDVLFNILNVLIYLVLLLVIGNYIEVCWLEQVEVLVCYIVYDLEVVDFNVGEDFMVQVSCVWLDFCLLFGEQQSDQVYVKLKVVVVLDIMLDGVISFDFDFVLSYFYVYVFVYLLFCLKEVISMFGYCGDIIVECIWFNGKVGGVEVGDFMML